MKTINYQTVEEQVVSMPVGEWTLIGVKGITHPADEDGDTYYTVFGWSKPQQAIVGRKTSDAARAAEWVWAAKDQHYSDLPATDKIVACRAAMADGIDGVDLAQLTEGMPLDELPDDVHDAIVGSWGCYVVVWDDWTIDRWVGDDDYPDTLMGVERRKDGKIYRCEDGGELMDCDKYDFCRNCGVYRCSSCTDAEVVNAIRRGLTSDDDDRTECKYEHYTIYRDEATGKSLTIARHDGNGEDGICGCCSCKIDKDRVFVADEDNCWDEVESEEEAVMDWCGNIAADYRVG